MAISILKSHIFRKQNSLQLLWPLPTNNGGFRCRRFPQFPLLLLPHHLPLLSHSLPFRHCFRVHPPPLSPLLRRCLHPLFYPMSSLSASQDAGNSTSTEAKTVSAPHPLTPCLCFLLVVIVTIMCHFFCVTNVNIASEYLLVNFLFCVYIPSPCLSNITFTAIY